MRPLTPTARLTPGLCPSYTFQQVQEHTDQIWKFQRHDLIEEYHGRPPAPPPLILLNHLQLLVRRGLLRQPATHHKLSEDQRPPPALCPLLRAWYHVPRHKAGHTGCGPGLWDAQRCDSTAILFLRQRRSWRRTKKLPFSRGRCT